MKFSDLQNLTAGEKGKASISRSVKFAGMAHIKNVLRALLLS